MNAFPREDISTACDPYLYAISARATRCERQERKMGTHESDPGFVSAIQVVFRDEQ